MEKLKNKVAIVTGAGSGMGKEIAKLFAKEGASVVVSDIDQIKAEDVAYEIKRFGGKAFAIKCDVSNQGDIDALFTKTLNHFQTLDILINNAGIMDNFVPVENLTDELWERVISVNTTGPMRTIRKAIPIFKAKQAGVIINVGSVAGNQGSRGGFAYTTSKHAINGMTKNVAFQYAEFNIRCNGILPGGVETNIQSTITDPDQFGLSKAMSGINFNPRMGNPVEIATLALFLATDDSSFVNGALIVADGGWTSY